MNTARAPHQANTTTVAWRLLWLALALVLGLRIGLSIVLPFADTTEARYAEIVRVGIEQGYWLMPHAAPGEPFFAKPAGSTWLSMGAALLLGASEWALRLPALLLMLGVWALCVALASPNRDERVRASPWIGLILLGSPLGFVLAGAVMTDALHVFAVTLAMAGATGVVFHPPQGQRVARAIFWLALGLGTLSKGLASVALAVLPVALYALWVRQPIQLARRFLAPGPMLLAVAVALPWYAAAEWAYPGFLRYFIVGEHLQRFLEPGWQGDRYGTAHRQPIGMIWAYAAGALGPWCLLGGFSLLRRNAPAPSASPSEASGVPQAWWLVWMLAPPLLFTFSRNIIWTYAATALPAAALWLGLRLSSSKPSAGVLLPVLILIWVAVLIAAAPTALRQVERNSARSLLARADEIDPERRLPVSVPGRLKFSGSYYSGGRSCVVTDPVSARARADAAGERGFVIVEESEAEGAQPLASQGRFVLLLRPSAAEPKP